MAFNARLNEQVSLKVSFILLLTYKASERALLSAATHIFVTILIALKKKSASFTLPRNELLCQLFE